MCDFCYNELFVDTKYGFAPKSMQYHWINCLDCQREIVDVAWIDDRGVLHYKMSGYRFVQKMHSLSHSISGAHYSS
jgi:hypothetical protein